MGLSDMELSDDKLDAIIGLVRQHTGIAMGRHKRVLLQGRLQPRLRALGLDNYGAYIARLEQDRQEVVSFINSVTTNDTAFFRTPAVWRWLERDFLPEWAARAEDGPLRIWSAAAATGEEAYSLAMTCLEARRNFPGLRFEILATDISTDALATARAAIYRGRSVERFERDHPELFRKYLRPVGEAVRVATEVTQYVEFGEHNLLQRPPRAAGFDLVMLRNVLIYFDAQAQQRVLAGARAAMRREARLVLGEQESITRLDTDFVFEQAHVYRIGD
ncbi:CheR family methyltransferase [Massilia oculi]|uniref:CheR family methyltransferase n=1 Tax=Massilia oculi TaxID=945844 RepID=UPI001E531538|nr:protein-glutamate O-methyltransferase CheR [Massilia oculi]